MYLPPALFKHWYANIYLRSPYWYRLRQRVIKKHKIKGRVDIHHLNYDRRGKPHWSHFIPVIGKWFVTGNERLSDLRPVTREAHKKIHGKDSV